MDTKKHLIILILKILETESDASHPITQMKIASMISDMYPCDRKTVGRNIGFLIKMGYPITKTTKGFYLDKKKFTVDEVKFVIKSVLDSPDKTTAEKEDIAKRLEEMLNKIYR